MPGTAAKVRVSEKQLAVLEELSRSRTAAKGIVQRALILVLGFQGLLNEQIAEEVGLNRQQVGVQGRKRWRDTWESLCVWECIEPHRLREAILEVLSDAAPGVSGENHRQAGRRADLSCGVRVAGVVGSSDHPLDPQRTAGRGGQTWNRGEHLGRVSRLLLEAVGRFSFYRSKMWLNTTEKNPETFGCEAAVVCQTYLDAPRKAAPWRHSHGERG